MSFYTQAQERLLSLLGSGADRSQLDEPWPMLLEAVDREGMEPVMEALAVAERKVAKIVIALERPGGGSTVLEFIRPEKVADLLLDPGSLGELFRDLLEDSTGSRGGS